MKPQLCSITLLQKKVKIPHTVLWWIRVEKFMIGRTQELVHQKAIDMINHFSENKTT
jgi:hypothetical protein